MWVRRVDSVQLCLRTSHLWPSIMHSSSRCFLEGAARMNMAEFLLTLLTHSSSNSNAWSLETLLKQGSSIGSALTFSQMAFIATHTLPSFITFQSNVHTSTWIPRLKPRAVPLSTWLVQVLLLVCMSLLNNWAFGYHVPLTVQIVVRSSGEGCFPLLNKAI